MSAIAGHPTTSRAFRVFGEIALPLVAAVLGSAMVSYLVASGYWYLALAMLLALPGLIVLNRYPMAIVMAWLLFLPLVGETSSAMLRKAFWLFHRGLPPLALAIITAAAMLGLRKGRLARLGWPEAMMGCYLLATLLSIAYTSSEPLTTAYVLYDTVFVPMCLYMVIRALNLDEPELKWLLPFVAFVLISQTFLGLISWQAPEVLPQEWLGKFGERTVGSLRAPEVFGTTMIFCGAFILHAGISSTRRIRRTTAVLLFGLAMLMVFLSFSRSVWMAGLIALCGTLFVYRGMTSRVLVLLIPTAAVLLLSGALSEQTQFARERFRSAESEESALSRLPIVYASLRMFEAKPLSGWGYQTFDRYDRQFQGTVGNLVAAEKDHASHNLYLTILAEQGLVGFILFIGPFVYWFHRWRRVRSHVPEGVFTGRRLIAMLWIVLAGFLFVNNFYRMQTPFALGMLWLILGLIAAQIARYEPASHTERRRRRRPLAVGSPR